MSKEAMTLALEALEGLEALLLSMGLTHLIVYGDAEKAITNLQKALASEALDKMAENAKELGLDYEPEQEPVAVWELQEDGWDTICDGDWLQTLPVGTKLYTTPPQRTWVGLTDDRSHQILLDMAKHIETFGDESTTEQALSAECIRFILERVTAHGIKKKA